MESALYSIYALVVFVSEISLVRCAHSFDFWYVNNSCVNTVRPHFPWSILYIFTGIYYLFKIFYMYIYVLHKSKLLTFELVKCHQKPRSSWLSLLHILHIDLLAYTSLFSMFAGLAIFFIRHVNDTWIWTEFCSSKILLFIKPTGVLMFW